MSKGRDVGTRTRRKTGRKGSVSGNQLKYVFSVVAVFFISGLAAYKLADKGRLPLVMDYRLLKHDVQDAFGDHDIKISLVGDVMLGGTAQEIYQRYGYEYAFEQTRKVLKRSDVIFGNLEGPLTNTGFIDPTKTYSFRSKPFEAATALKYGGFSVMSLANNHTLDYGPDGLTQTIATMDAFGIQHVGAGDNESVARQAQNVNVDGHRIAFLAYSLTLPETFWASKNKPGTAFGKLEHIVEDVAAAKKNADIVLVSMHWGQESTTELMDYQKSVGHAIIDAGATIVIGHHPHILQAVESYKGGVILYSLGNFAFGSYSKKVDTSVIAQAYFKDNRIKQLRLWPIRVRNVDVLFQSKLLHDDRGDQTLQQLRELSLNRGTFVEFDEGTGVINFPS